MARIARSIHIGAPPADVWAAMADLERWPVWASQFKRLERLDAGPLARGSRVRVRPKGMAATVWQITEYEEGRSFTWASSPLPGLQLTGGHVVTADREGANAEFWLEAGGPLGSVLAPLLRRTVFNRNTKSATEGLKRYLAGEARPPT